MTGPEHYQRAEREISLAGSLNADGDHGGANRALLRAIAHGVLALTGAIAELETERAGEHPVLTRPYYREADWHAVLNPPEPEADR